MIKVVCFFHTVAGFSYRETGHKAYFQEAMFICADTCSVDSYPKAEPQTQRGVALYTSTSFPLTFWFLCPPYKVTYIL